MHHQRRSQAPYPDRLTDLTELDQFQWEELNHNVGACMSVRRADAIRFGGFDEHPSFRGYLCGPYDLGWRLVNAGLREVWHDPSVALWHFAHPRPADAGHQFSWRRWREVTHTHVDFHALTAVEAFSTGRLLPLRENAEIHELRMNSRLIGSAYERRYATMTGPGGFPLSQRTKLQGQRLRHPFRRYAQKFGLWPKRKPKPQESDE